MVSKVRDEELTMVGHTIATAGVIGGHHEGGALTHQNTQHADAEAVVAEATTKLQLQIIEVLQLSFAPRVQITSDLCAPVCA